MLKHLLVHGPLRFVQVMACAGAALLFPLHLGWIGASWGDFAVYLVVASLLLSLPAAILVRPLLHPVWQVILIVSSHALLLLAIPATLAFWLGSTAGPLDEALDESLCASQGMAEDDTLEADLDDTLDLTPDCVPAATPSGVDAGRRELGFGR